MVGGHPQERQAQRDRHPLTLAQQLDRDVPLVVVHGDNQIGPSGRRPREQRVRGHRPRHVDAQGPLGLDRRADEPLVLVAQKAALPGVRVEAGHRDPRRPAEQPAPETVGQLDRPPHAGDRDRLDGPAQRAVRGHVNHPQRARHQQHPQVAGPAQAGQHLGLARPRVPGQLQRLLGHRGGDQRVRRPSGQQLHRRPDRLDRGPAARRRSPAHRHRAGGDQDRTVRGRPVHRPGHRELGQTPDARVGQHAADQFRADPAGITRGDHQARRRFHGSRH